MNQDVANLNPTEVWTSFEELNAVPRPSKKEERVVAFIKNFGQRLGFETIEDSIGNVIIRKPASPGKENVTGVVLQAHLDMVHQKNADTEFDFNSQGIESYIDGDWVKANGTTLGSDNGIGVASVMAVLKSTTISHGPIEALFTIDEETGMTGAMNLQPGVLKGKILLNTDTEDEGELCIGCAGGIDTNASLSYETEPAAGDTYELSVTGLKGGHSGCEIHLGRANANKIMNRLLGHLQESDLGMQISSINGGSLRNAIPRESFAIINFKESDTAKIRSAVDEVASEIKSERRTSEPELAIELKQYDSALAVMNAGHQATLLNIIYASPNGVERMSEDIEGLVETSTNLARVSVDNGVAGFQFLTRSSVESARDQLIKKIESIFKLAGGSVEHTGGYPGWTPNPKSKILTHMKSVYQREFGKEPSVNAVHAGLECGMIGSAYPEMDMISFGPTIKNPHSPDEKCHIESVQKYWRYLTAVLESIE